MLCWHTPRSYLLSLRIRIYSASWLSLQRRSNWIRDRLAGISQELAVQNKEDLDAYKDQIQKDPEAYNEMLNASDEFARENNEGGTLKILQIQLLM